MFKAITDEPAIAFIFYSSIGVIIISAILCATLPDKIGWNVLIIVLMTLSSSVFFPLIAGCFYDKFKEKREGSLIWRAIREFVEAGILKIYKDREKSKSEGEFNDDAQKDLNRAFDEHHSGEIKMIGVSLRVFFHDLGPFYENIANLRFREQVSMSALICSKTAPEVENRRKIETAKEGYHGICDDIDKTEKEIKKLKQEHFHDRLQYGFYSSAPYCTLIIFPEKCYFAPNILSPETPQRLPMVVLKKGSHGYKVLEGYFDYLWDIWTKSIDVEECTEPQEV